jgi:hypothetical protein
VTSRLLDVDLAEDLKISSVVLTSAGQIANTHEVVGCTYSLRQEVVTDSKIEVCENDRSLRGWVRQAVAKTSISAM